MAEQTLLDAPTTKGRGAGVAIRGGKFLTFQLEGEIFGLEILKVQEIMGLIAITRVPRTPHYIRGVINLRGKVIPVVDLRLKFGMAQKVDTDRSCIIVVQVARNGSQVTMGTIVDEVSEVLDIQSEQIEHAPEFGHTVDTTFILGIGKVGLKVVLLLDVDKVLTVDEAETISQIADTTEA